MWRTLGGIKRIASVTVVYPPGTGSIANRLICSSVSNTSYSLLAAMMAVTAPRLQPTMLTVSMFMLRSNFRCESIQTAAKTLSSQPEPQTRPEVCEFCGVMPSTDSWNGDTDWVTSTRGMGMGIVSV